METLRGWLNEAGFDWVSGHILVQNKEYAPVWAKWIEHDDPMLDEPFDTGYGCDSAPLFIAEDARAIYLHDVYDGSTSWFRVLKDISGYLDFKGHRIPTPGGG